MGELLAGSYSQQEVKRWRYESQAAALAAASELEEKMRQLLLEYQAEGVVAFSVEVAPDDENPDGCVLNGGGLTATHAGLATSVEFLIHTLLPNWMKQMEAQFGKGDEDDWPSEVESIM